MRNLENMSFDPHKAGRLCIPISLIRRSTPEEAADLFDRLFDAAERTFGEYPAFEMRTDDGRLLYVRPREQPDPTPPPGR